MRSLRGKHRQEPPVSGQGAWAQSGQAAHQMPRQAAEPQQPQNPSQPSYAPQMQAPQPAQHPVPDATPKAAKKVKAPKAPRPAKAPKAPKAPKPPRAPGKPLLRRAPKQGVRRDPAPSRWAYRFHRLWLTPLYRSLLRVGIPSFLLITIVGWYFSNPTNRFAITEKVESVRRTFEERPEFMVKLMAIDGASPVVDEAIREMIPVEFPISSFDLDLDEMHRVVAELDVIEEVSVRIRPGGVLEINVTERDPVVIWREAGGLDMLDATGHRVASLANRAARADLPLIVGASAGEAVPEALRLMAAGEELAPRLRGLVRVGARRWDVVLDNDQRILLPEKNPVAALEQVLALDETQDVLARAITDIDMRNPLRPTLRMTPEAAATLREVRALSGDLYR